MNFSKWRNAKRNLTIFLLVCFISLILGHFLVLSSYCTIFNSSGIFMLCNFYEFISHMFFSSLFFDLTSPPPPPHTHTPRPLTAVSTLLPPNPIPPALPLFTGCVFLMIHWFYDFYWCIYLFTPRCMISLTQFLPCFTILYVVPNPHDLWVFHFFLCKVLRFSMYLISSHVLQISMHLISSHVLLFHVFPIPLRLCGIMGI